MSDNNNIIMFDSCSDAIFESSAAKLKEATKRINERLAKQQGLPSIEIARIVYEELGYDNPNEGRFTLE